MVRDDRNSILGNNSKCIYLTVTVYGDSICALAGEEDSDDDDDDLEAAQLEKMVAKLARIVKHVIPNRSIELDENVDKNTSNWLAQVSGCTAVLYYTLLYTSTGC